MTTLIFHFVPKSVRVSLPKKMKTRRSKEKETTKEKIIRYLIALFIMAGVVYSAAKLFPKSIEKPVGNNDKVSVEKSFILKEHTAYGVKVGFTKDQVYERFPKEDIKMIDLFLEGMPAPAMEISIDSKPCLMAELVNDKVYRIRVLDPRFKTPEGIRIGSTLKELEKAYNEVIFGSGEGSIFARVRAVHMAFELDCVDKVPLEWYKTHDRDLIDDDTKIIKILVF